MVIEHGLVEGGGGLAVAIVDLLGGQGVGVDGVQVGNGVGDDDGTVGGDTQGGDVDIAIEVAVGQTQHIHSTGVQVDDAQTADVLVLDAVHTAGVVVEAQGGDLHVLSEAARRCSSGM